MIRARVVVSGRVQGVGFRYYTARRAAELGVVGFVRNEPDGSVLVEAEGEPEAVADLVQWLRHGPQGARVRSAVTSELPPVGATDFSVEQ